MIECTLNDQELIEKARKWITELCETGGRAWTVRVPADVNKDPDFIFMALVNRLRNNKFQKLQDDVSNWIDEKISNRGALPSAYKLQEENKELIDAIIKLNTTIYTAEFQNEQRQKDTDALGYEYADCLICLLDSAKKSGLNINDLIDYAIKKFEIVKTRQYGDPDTNGVIHHV